jgi:hypothetical protein
MLSFFMQLNLCNYGLIEDIFKFIFIEPLPTPIELCNRTLTTKLNFVLERILERPLDYSCKIDVDLVGMKIIQTFERFFSSKLESPCICGLTNI